MMNYGWGGWLVGGLVMLLFWGGLIALVVFTIRAFAGANQNKTTKASSGETALDILKRRYAQGEIDQAKYEAMRRDIET
jgi:putative membrane protein